MDFKHCSEICQVHFREAFVTKDSGVVHQDIDTTPLRHDLLDHIGHVIGIRNVGRVRHCLATKGLDLSDDCHSGIAILTLAVY